MNAILFLTSVSAAIMFVLFFLIAGMNPHSTARHSR